MKVEKIHLHAFKLKSTYAKISSVPNRVVGGIKLQFETYCESKLAQKLLFMNKQSFCL